MALSDKAATREQMLEAQRRSKERRESLARAAEIEAARASDVREWIDAEGNRWRYVLLDGREARIERCEAHVARVSVPDRIEDRPVVALAADALARLPGIEEVRCPDTVLSIGFCAFRENARLRKAVLPPYLAVFDPDWFRRCSALEHLVLPGRLPEVDARVLDLSGLRTLVIGAGTAGVAPGAFAKSSLHSVQIDAANPFLATDGRAVYRRDGAVLVALAVPVEAYAVRPGCRAVAKKGFSTFSCVERVEMPEGLEELGPFALSGTGIASFDAPATLRRIGEKAFFNCAALAEAHLNEGLESIADNAFSGTVLRELRVPASTKELGNPLAAHTSLTYSGDRATFSIAEGSANLVLEADGALYREAGQGRCLVRMMDPDARRCVVRAGTVAIDEEAFAHCAHLAEAVLPEGLVDIGRAAFKGCRRLVRANIPDSVHSIGDEAFLDTSLEILHLPGALEWVGENALVTFGAHHGEAPSLRTVTVGEGDGRFYTAPGLLLERTGAKCSRVVLCTGEAKAVCVPPEVDEIAPYAFNGVRGLSELRLSDRIASVGIRGLGVDGLVGLIHLDLAEPVSGHESFELRFPDTDRGTQQMMLALGVPDHVDVSALFEHYDHAVANGSGFDAQDGCGLDVYEQAVRMVGRLMDPVFLTPVNRSIFERALRGAVEDVCAAASRHDDRKLVDALLDLGFLDAGNIYAAIDRVSALQDAAMTAHLLEARRLRFKQDSPDFDL